MTKIYIEDGPTVGYNADAIAYSKDGQSWNRISKEGISFSTTFMPILNKGSYKNYPHNQLCEIVIIHQEGKLRFDLQDVQNAPFNTFPANEPGLQQAMALMNAW